MSFEKIENLIFTQLKMKKIKLIYFLYNCKVFNI